MRFFLSFVAAATAGRPNFIFVLTDDQDILLNGTAAMPTLAREFERGGASLHGFVDVPVCCPSRTSTLSARYSHNLNNTELGWCGDYHRVHENHTWIGALRASGYSTAIFGKYTNEYELFCDKKAYVPSDFSYANLLCTDNSFFGNAFNVNGSMRQLGKDDYVRFDANHTCAPSATPPQKTNPNPTLHPLNPNQTDDQFYWQQQPRVAR